MMNEKFVHSRGWGRRAGLEVGAQPPRLRIHHHLVTSLLEILSKKDATMR